MSASTAPATSQSEIDRSLSELAKGAAFLPRATCADLRRLAEQCLRGTSDCAREWVEAACRAKGIPPGSPCRAEEIAAGPVTTVRYLRLIDRTLDDIEQTGRPMLPGPVRQTPGGRLEVPIFPARGLFDPVVFAGFRVGAWMQRHVSPESFWNESRCFPGNGGDSPAKISLVLGAGNVSSISATDVFTKIFQEGKVVLLKMNPVNDYLGPIFEKAYVSLVEAGCLRIVYGGGDVGQAAVEHDLVDEVHITGSVATHDAIVWGPPGPERERRKQQNDPLLKKPITSELGNVSPWIVIPGRYKDRQLKFQAENIAASITNNASFNCLATKVIVTHKEWPDRDRFLDMIEDVLKRVPPRRAYYPGAFERYRRFTGQSHSEDSGSLPWTIVRDVNPDDSPVYFREESFVCVAAETALSANSSEEFLERAVDFANERLWGTLCAAITLSPDFTRRRENDALLDRALEKLNYGSVGINHWPGLIYAMMTPPWGGALGSSLDNAQSGRGWVHNTYLLDGVEKTVLVGPLTLSPKPFWFPTHRAPEPMAWRLLGLYERPTMLNLTKLLTSALAGVFR